MERIPNWFRWTLIALATLIMCSCRASFDVSTQPLPLGSNLPVASEEDLGALRTSFDAERPASSLPRKDLVEALRNVRQTVSPPGEQTDLHQQLPPIVRKSETGLQVQSVAVDGTDSQGVEPNRNKFQPTTSTKAPIVSAKQRDLARNHKQHTDGAVFFKIQDENVTPVAQLESVIADNATTPFADDPLPVTDTPNLVPAPIVEADHFFGNQAATITEGAPQVIGDGTVTHDYGTHPGATEHGVIEHGVTEHGVTEHGVTEHPVPLDVPTLEYAPATPPLPVTTPYVVDSPLGFDGYADTVIAPMAPESTAPISSSPIYSSPIDCTTPPAGLGSVSSGVAIGSGAPWCTTSDGSGYCGPIVSGIPANAIPSIPWMPVDGRPINGNPVELYPDEYICDGGDMNGRVQVDRDWTLRGLDPEDTIGHYDTIDGRVVVEPSNSVCLYAPRFAATRLVTSPFESERSVNLVSAEVPVTAVVDEILEGTDLYSQNVAAQRHLMIQPASTFKHRDPGVEASQAQGIIDITKDIPPHEDLRIIRLGVHKQAEKPMLAEFAAKAVSWSHDTAVQVVLDEVIAQTRVHNKNIEEVFSLGHKGSPKLRVIKTASVSDALPGEEVEFTLRFDNVGFQTIGNVTIVDNLTTRLEYVKDSEDCTVDANFVTDANSSDSLTLRWEISEPLHPGKGGVIRFRCRVR